MSCAQRGCPKTERLRVIGGVSFCGGLFAAGHASAPALEGPTGCLARAAPGVLGRHVQCLCQGCPPACARPRLRSHLAARSLRTRLRGGGGGGAGVVVRAAVMVLVLLSNNSKVAMGLSKRLMQHAALAWECLSLQA